MWIPDTQTASLIKEISPMRKSVYIVNSLPWPLWSREIFLEAGSYVMKEHKALGISLESIKSNSYFGHKIERHPT